MGSVTVCIFKASYIIYYSLDQNASQKTIFYICQTLVFFSLNKAQVTFFQNDLIFFQHKSTEFHPWVWQCFVYISLTTRVSTNSDTNAWADYSERYCISFHFSSPSLSLSVWSHLGPTELSCDWHLFGVVGQLWESVLPCNSLYVCSSFCLPFDCTQF